MTARHDAGFTLVETLVTLALTAMVATFVLGGIDVARRSWLASQARERPEEIDAGRGRLRDLLARTVPADTIDESSGLARLAFDGRHDSLTFVTLNDVSAARGGLMRVRLAPAKVRDSNDLMLRTGVFRADPARIAEDEPVTLFRQMSDLVIDYFGAAARGQPPQWRPDWTRQDILPQLVRVQLSVGRDATLRRIVIPVALRMAQ